MKKQHTLAGAGAILASAAVIAAPAALAAPANTVTVRIEGLHKTLLATKTVTIPSGNLTFSGHSYKGNTFLGALEAATKGKASGSWSSYGAFVTKILGETESGTTDYWTTIINGVPTSLGASSQPVKAGETLLVAAVGTKEEPAAPIDLVAPATATAKKTVTLKVEYYTAKGKLAPLAGATILANGKVLRSGSAGTVSYTPAKAGTVTLNASKSGYIRDGATLTVK